MTKSGFSLWLAPVCLILVCLAPVCLALGAPEALAGEAASSLVKVSGARVSGAKVSGVEPSGTRPRSVSGGVEHIVVRVRNGAGTEANYRARNVALGPLGVRRVLDVPFSVMTVPHDVIVNQQARNINDLAKYLPSVQLEERGDPNTSRPQSRGFEADVVSNSRIDGLNVAITTPYAAEQFDSLQVLNGLAGALYGPQNPAGTFDYTLKRPTDRKAERFVVGVDSDGAPLEALDVSGRAAWFGYRLNLLNQQGTGYVQDSHLRRGLVSGDFDIRLDPKTVIQIDASQYSYATRGLPGQFSYSATTSLPAAPDLGVAHYGQPQAGFNAETNTALAKIIHHFSDRWSLTLGGLYQNAFRQVFTTANQLLDGSGGYRQTISAAASAKNFKIGSNLAYLNGVFRTGGVCHEVILGTNGYMMGNYNPLSAQSFVLGKAAIGRPVAFSSPQPDFSGTYKSAQTFSQTLMVGDTLSLGRRWSVMGTLAWSWLGTDNFSKAEVRTARTASDAVFTPMASLIYRPQDSQSLYFTWGRSIQAGTIAPVGSVNANTVTGPLRSGEYEVGYKILLAERVQVNLAGFRMARPYGFTDPQTRIYGNFGTQRNYGVEFQVSGHVMPDLAVLGGMTWLDAVLGATGNARTSNKEVVGVAPLMANILLDYSPPFLCGAAINANVHYMGRRAANVYGTTSAASVVTLDLGARYAVHVYRAPLTFRFGVYNVTGRNYWASVYPSSINGGGTATDAAVAGLPRTYSLTVALDL